MSPTGARRSGRVLAALSGLVLLAGCTSGSRAPSAPVASGSTPAGAGATSFPSVGRYVALGDSYSAGPLIPTTDLAAGCVRSDHNYPSLVARQLDVTRFVDVTCSGATTHDLTHTTLSFGGARIPAQIRAVTRRTDLVTLGIGGNDLRLFSTLVNTCTGLRSSDPTGDPCTRDLARRGVDVARTAATIRTNVTRSLRAIRTRAPGARVLLVGYLRLVPDSGTCAELPLATGDYAEGRRISRALDRALSTAAKRAGVQFVDMYAESVGHDICAPDPWVNGSTSDQSRAAAYHPFESGMRADADRVLAALL